MSVRRLVGPTVLSLVLCGLLADYLLLNGSPWSVTRFLGIVASIVAGVLTIPNDAPAFAWMPDLWFPLSLGLLALVLVRLMVGQAKRAMGQVRDTTAPPLSDVSPNTIDSTPVSEQLLPTNGFWEPSGFPRKLVGILISVVVLFGSMTCVIVFKFLEPAVKQHVHDRAGIMALGLRELFAGELLASQMDLSGAVASYAVREKVEYVYLEDKEGRIIAHWPADLPRYLRRDFPDSSIRALAGTIVDYRGMSLYAVAKRIEQGRAAFVHVAVDQGNIHEAIRQVVLSVALTIAALAVICCISLFVWSTRAIQGPWSELIKHASRISTGDFSGALPLEREDEFGDIARSLERLRSSLHAATARFSAR